MDVRVSELNQNISAVLAKAQTEAIAITKHGKAAAVLINPERYQKYLEQTEAKPAYKTAYDFFETLPKVEAFDLPEREDADLRDVTLLNVSVRHERPFGVDEGRA